MMYLPNPLCCEKSCLRLVQHEVHEVTLFHEVHEVTLFHEVHEVTLCHWVKYILLSGVEIIYTSRTNSWRTVTLSLFHIR